MNPQVTLLRKPPSAELFQPVRNAPHPHGPIVDWMVNHYTGNKPSGGLWTSSRIVDGPYCSDWAYGLQKNAAIRLGYQPDAALRAWVSDADQTAHVLHINSLADAICFTEEYRRSEFTVPQGLRDTQCGKLITGQLTDWERALKEYDGVHLSEEAADGIAWEIKNYSSVHDTAFHTWNCESTFWGRWKFKDWQPI